MAFIEVEFPRTISYKAMGGPGFNTTVNESKAGFEQRNQNWSVARGKWTVSLTSPTKQTSGAGLQQFIDQVSAFFYVASGRANGFRLKDHKDFTNGSAPQFIATGDGVTGTFQLIKTYAVGSLGYVRNIVKPMTSLVSDYLNNPLTDTIDVLVNNVSQTHSAGYVGSGSAKYTVDETLGQITFQTYSKVKISSVTVSGSVTTYGWSAVEGDTTIHKNQQIVVSGLGIPHDEGTFIITGITPTTFTVTTTTQDTNVTGANGTGLVYASYLNATITTVSMSGSNATYTYSAGPTGQTIAQGMRVFIKGMTNAGNNGTFYVTNTGAGTFTVVNASGVNATTQGGTGAFDWVPNAGQAIDSTYQFHFPVRFDTDELAIQIEDSDIKDGDPIITWNAIVLRELRLVNGTQG